MASATALHEQAKALLRKGRFRDAVALLRKAVAAAPDRVAPLIHLARAQLLAGDSAAALATIEALVGTEDSADRRGDGPELTPVLRAPLHKMRGDLLQARGDLHGAEAAFRLAHRLASRDERCANALGAVLCKLGRYREGIAIYLDAARRAAGREDSAERADREADQARLVRREREEQEAARYGREWEERKRRG